MATRQVPDDPVGEPMREAAGMATTRASSVLEYDKPLRNGEHPTMKPVGLISECLANSTRAVISCTSRSRARARP